MGCQHGPAVGGRLLGKGIGLVSRMLLERLVDEEELHVYRTGCFVGSVSFLGLDQRFSAGSLHQGLLSAMLLSFQPSKTRTLSEGIYVN